MGGPGSIRPVSVGYTYTALLPEPRHHGNLIRLSTDQLKGVVSIDPVVLQDVDLYWRKLLEVCAVERLPVRCRTVVPENYARLPAHMSLTSKLLASPRALTRIQLYCKNRPGYIVPGVLGGEEVGPLCCCPAH